MITTPHLSWQIDDGGRAAAGYRGEAGDCGARAVAIAAGLPYQDVYDLINRLAVDERQRGRSKRSSAREGVHPRTLGQLLFEMGADWVSCMSIGSGCKVHLRADELPRSGRYVLRLSRHYAAWVDGVLHDLSDCSRDGMRCVYGYWVISSGVQS